MIAVNHSVSYKRGKCTIDNCIAVMAPVERMDVSSADKAVGERGKSQSTGIKLKKLLGETRC